MDKGLVAGGGVVVVDRFWFFRRDSESVLGYSSDNCSIL